MNATDLPTVAMCGNPQCGGWKACDCIPAEPLFAITDWLSVGADPADVVRFFLGELAMAKASDTSGLEHVAPRGDFTVHKGGTEGRPDWAPADSVAWTCTYLGPATSKDEALADAPLWSEEVMQARVACLSGA